MNFKKEDLTQMDTAINCLRFDDIAYYKISKELTKKFFLENKLIPRDHFGKENEDYRSVSTEMKICSLKRLSPRFTKTMEVLLAEMFIVSAI